MKRIASAWKIGAVVALLGAGALAAYAVVPASEEVIKVSARKFDYAPGVITLRKGVPVILEFTTQDVLMGFNAPDLGVRTDIIPGKVARVRIVPDKTGSFTFYCDIFCGSGHEDMSGVITVTE